MFIGEVEFDVLENASTLTVNNLPQGFSLRDENFVIPDLVPVGVVKRYSIVEDATRDILTSAFMEGGDVWEYVPRTQRAFILAPQFKRANKSISTSSLAPNTKEILNLDTPGGFEVVTFSTSSPARVRAYPTQTLALADQNRDVSIEPSGLAGCLLEVVTTADNLTVSLGPSVHLLGSNSSSVSIIVENLDTVNRNIMVSFEGITTEF